MSEPKHIGVLIKEIANGAVDHYATERKRSYQIYMLSERWEDKRNELFKERGRRCEVCGTGQNIQVHHNTYKRFENEDLEDLNVLCKQHHEEIHK
jgi:hypothetical protein